MHVPFCESVCYYCACNKVITKHHERAAEYLRYLAREVELQVQHFGKGHNVSQLHLGGGTPTFLSDAELEDLMAHDPAQLHAGARWASIRSRWIPAP